MENRTISYVSMACFLAGFIGMWIAFDQPRETRAMEWNESMQGQRVQVSAVIESAYENRGHLFLVLRDDENDFHAVLYNASESQQQIARRGARVKAVGKLQFNNHRAELRLERLD